MAGSWPMGQPDPTVFKASLLVVAMTFGIFCYHGGKSESSRTAGKLFIFFGGQVGMNLSMKAVFSSTAVSQDLHLRGVPAGFLATALQQLVAFILFLLLMLFSRLTPWPYHPRRLTTMNEWIAVLCLSLSFAMNIGLNNTSLIFLAISVNLIIRGCLPLPTYVCQLALGRFFGQAGSTLRPSEVCCLALGVACAVLVTISQVIGSGERTHASGNLFVGVLLCVVSTFSGALNLTIAGLLGTTFKLNALDTTCYMALPAGLFLLLPGFTVRHGLGGGWPDQAPMTDWEVFRMVFELSPGTLGLVALSGVLAFMYNVLQYLVVQTLSASTTAFAGSFNKAASIALSLLFALESLPDCCPDDHPGCPDECWQWGTLMMVGVAGNLVSFATYSASTSVSKQAADDQRGDGPGRSLTPRLDAVSCCEESQPLRSSSPRH